MSWIIVYIFPRQIKYSSKLLSLQAFGLNLESFLYLCLIGQMRSRISSQTNTFKRRFPHFFRKTSATSSIARFNSTDLYWSTHVIHVVEGAISDVMVSNWCIPRLWRYDCIFSNSKTLSFRRWMFEKPKFGSIFCISIPTAFHFSPIIFAITWRKLHGAAPISRIFIPGFTREYLSCISMSLKALRARYPIFFAFSKYGSWTINGFGILFDNLEKSDNILRVSFTNATKKRYLFHSWFGNDMTWSFSSWSYWILMSYSRWEISNHRRVSDWHLSSIRMPYWWWSSYL